MRERVLVARRRRLASSKAAVPAGGQGKQNSPITSAVCIYGAILFLLLERVFGRHTCFAKPLL